MAQPDVVSRGWAQFAGAVIVLAAIKEIARLLAGPAAEMVKPSRREEEFGIAVLLGLLNQLGRAVLHA